MHGLRNLSGGLLTGLIMTATVFGALILSVGGQPLIVGELPVPTVTIPVDFTVPAPTRASTQQAATAVAAAPSLTPTSTPTICPIPPDWQRFSVGPFDTLIAIGQRFNLTPDQLVQANCLQQPNIVVGQTIYVPGFKPTPTSAPCPPPPFNWVRYIVRPGETLSSIAARYGMGYYTLMRINCLSTTYINYGQMLYVPAIYPIVTPPPTPIIPTFTPTPPIASLTPTIQPSVTPTVTPTTPIVTVTFDTPTPEPTTPVPTTPAPTTPAPSDTPPPTVVPSDTPPPAIVPTQSPPTSTRPPPPTETTSP
jgi:LysM repeat protein